MILPLLRPNSALALARVSVENLKVTINMKHEYLYYCNRWFDGVKASLNPDYEDPKSVRKANHASDVFRKAAADIGKYYPDKVECFAKLLEHSDAEIRVHAAISIVEYMPHTKEQLSLAKKIIQEYMLTCDGASQMRWNWWLNQLWASESSCIDYYVENLEVIVKHEYLYYYKRWFDGVKASLNPDYEDPKSVRKANHASDVFRKAAADIGKYYPDKVECFAKLLEHSDAEIRVHAAISIVQHMPHTKEQLSLAKKIIQEYMLTCNVASQMGWKWWLNQPWTNESLCIDY